MSGLRPERNGNWRESLRGRPKYANRSPCECALLGDLPAENSVKSDGIPPIAVRSPKPRARLESTTPSPAEPRWRPPPPRSPPENQSADAVNFSIVRDRLALMAAEAT